MNVANKKIILNFLSTGVVAFAATKIVLGEYENVTYYGMDISAPFATGLGCGVGSVISDLTSEYAIQKLNISNQLMSGSTLAVKAGIGAIASAGVLYGGGLPSESLVTALLVGGGSKLGGDYVSEKLFDPAKGIIGMPF